LSDTLGRTGKQLPPLLVTTSDAENMQNTCREHAEYMQKVQNTRRSKKK